MHDGRNLRTTAACESGSGDSRKRDALCGLRTAGRQTLNSTNDLRRTALRRGLRPSFPGDSEIYEIAEEANP